jgi:hypothetical protein
MAVLRSVLPPTMVLVIAVALGCGSESSTEPADPVAVARTQTYDRINQLRASVALPPLTVWTGGEGCADGQALADYTADTPHSTFGQCGESAQNECPGWPAISQIPTDCLQAMWDEGPGSDPQTHGHYINLTNTSYHQVAVGFYVSPTNVVWATMNFAP